MAVRGKLGLAGAAVAILLMGPAGDSAGAAERRGFITVKKNISLYFIDAGTYAGTLTLGEPKVAKNAKSKNGKKAGHRAKRNAAGKARALCKSHIPTAPVQVVHLSKPPFLIGADKPTAKGIQRYWVTGPEPPRGDRVRASQNAKSIKFSFAGFKWEAWCRRANIVKPFI